MNLNLSVTLAIFAVAGMLFGACRAVAEMHQELKEAPQGGFGKGQGNRQRSGAEISKAVAVKTKDGRGRNAG